MKRTPLKRTGFKARDRLDKPSEVRGSTLSRSKPLKAKKTIHNPLTGADYTVHPKIQGQLGIALARTIIAKVSDKQKARNAEWSKAKRERESLIIETTGYLRCEYCHKPMSEYDGHHNDWNRAHNTLSNCRLVHRACHSWIHDHNVKDVPSILPIDMACYTKVPRINNL